MKFDSIIFDMDGVLVTNDSYNQAIIRTVDFVLQNIYGKKTSAGSKEIGAMKKITGFNNDWDVSFALIKLLKQEVKIDEFKREVLKITPGVRQSKKYKETKDIFQSYYLGEKIFKKVYSRQCPVIVKRGLIEFEEMLLEIKILESLSRKYKLAIATSRPRFEAIFAVRFQKITPKYISEKFIIAKEDCKREKPYPDPLLEAKKRIKAIKPVYIGDTINDVIAAKKAGMFSIYVGEEQIGDYKVKSVNELKEVLI